MNFNKNVFFINLFIHLLNKYLLNAYYFPGIASLVAQLVKNLPAMKETQVRFLDWEDPLEEGTASHSSILAWRSPMDRGAWWVAVLGVAESQARLND